MEKNAFAERERALENEFFYRVDKELLARLRKRLKNEAARDALAAASGFKDEQLLEELVELGISPDTLASLALAPLVFVAWADHKVDDKERMAVLDEAHNEGILEGTPSWEMLKFWLENEPTPMLHDAWRHMMQAVRASLSEESNAALEREILSKARTIAKSSGRRLAGGRISVVEHRMLDELEAALHEA